MTARPIWQDEIPVTLSVDDAALARRAIECAVAHLDEARKHYGKVEFARMLRSAAAALDVVTSSTVDGSATEIRRVHFVALFGALEVAVLHPGEVASDLPRAKIVDRPIEVTDVLQRAVWDYDRVPANRRPRR